MLTVFAIYAKVHRIVFGLSFRSAAFEHYVWETGADLFLGQALVWMGVHFS